MVASNWAVVRLFSQCTRSPRRISENLLSCWPLLHATCGLGDDLLGRPEASTDRHAMWLRSLQSWRFTLRALGGGPPSDPLRPNHCCLYCRAGGDPAGCIDGAKERWLSLLIGNASKLALIKACLRIMCKWPCAFCGGRKKARSIAGCFLRRMLRSFGLVPKQLGRHSSAGCHGKICPRTRLLIHCQVVISLGFLNPQSAGYWCRSGSLESNKL